MLGVTSWHRLSAVLIVGAVLSSAGAIWLRPGPGAGASAVDDPTLAGPVPTVAPTTVPATSVPVPPTVAVDPTIVRPPRPVSVPTNPRQREPLIEIGTIEIPRIGLTHRVFHGISLSSINEGPSHWPGTAFPGEAGNSVFAGHRTTRTKPFRNLDQLAPGDEVIFNVGGVRSVYAVTGTEIVPPSALQIVNPTPTPTVTLFACHPPGSARFRIVVRAALVSAESDSQ